MTHGPLTYLSTRELVGLPNNPRTITQADLNRLCDSIRDNGFWEHRPLGVERQGNTLVVLDGNQRLKAARRLKMKTVPVVIYEGLTDQEREDLILRSNINNGTWGSGLLQSDFAGVDFEAIGLNIELPAPLELEPSQEPSAEEPLQDEPDEGEVEQLSFFQKMLGDYVYPSDNEWGIPDGYNAFFTRGVSGWQDHLDLNLEIAQCISGCDRPNLNVYGGGKDIEDWCNRHQVSYIGEWVGHRPKFNKQ